MRLFKMTLLRSPPTLKRGYFQKLSSVSLFLFLSFTSSLFLMCQGGTIKQEEKSLLEAISNEPVRIKMLAPPIISKKHTRTRQNSRFLRTFPPVELLQMARQAYENEMTNEIDPFPSFPQRVRRPSHSQRFPPGGLGLGLGGPMKSNRIEAGNSPIFYIKLPPVPYVFLPGVGYVSPHPYSSNNAVGGMQMPPMPMPFSMGGSGSGQGMAPFLSSSSSSSGQESSEQSVISLPLKFLSNGRPHQIESHKRKKRPGLGPLGSHPNHNSNPNSNSNYPNDYNNSFESSSKVAASLISGGKYSFNGRPTAVFVVRSPASRQHQHQSHVKK